MRDIDPAIWEAISFITACTVLMLLLFAPVGAIAATKQIRTPVYGTLSSNQYAGCMLQVKDFAQATGLNCPEGSNGRVWLTLDCNGNWMPRSAADRNFRQGQTALLTGSSLTMLVDDSKKAGGYCLAKQIILFR